MEAYCLPGLAALAVMTCQVSCSNILSECRCLVFAEIAFNCREGPFRTDAQAMLAAGLATLTSVDRRFLM